MTRMPRWSDSATFSAACRQTEQVRNRLSPSFHSLVCRSKVRGVDATRNFATAAPDGVKRSSGSSTRLPTTVMTVSPAIGGTSRRVCCWLLVLLLEIPSSAERESSVGLGAEDLGPEDRLVQVHLAVELLDDRRLGLQVDDRVDALGLLLDLVRETTTAPGVDLLDLSVALTDDGEEVLDQRGDSALLEIGVEDDHHLVVTHVEPTSFGLSGHGRSVAGGS